ncbi:MAG TPA: OsmC family protein, partial [Candidatus Deferrimicrobiaceae bacterium]
GGEETELPQKTVKVAAELFDKYRIEVKADNHVIRIDQPASGGGTDSGPNPLLYMLGALAGCVGTVARIVANRQHLPLRGLRVGVEGDIDTDFLLGRTKEGRAGFQAIRVTVDVDADMTQEAKEAFIREVDSRCPISENLLNSTPMEYVVR